MYAAKACIEFSAAHRMSQHVRCSNIHGHNYRVCVWVREDKPMDVDLDELYEWLYNNVYKKFDHQYLNTVLPGNGEAESVTSEEVAVYIAEQLDRKYPGRVLRVEVCETSNLCIEYTPPGGVFGG